MSLLAFSEPFCVIATGKAFPLFLRSCYYCPSSKSHATKNLPVFFKKRK